MRPATTFPLRPSILCLSATSLLSLSPGALGQQFLRVDGDSAGDRHGFSVAGVGDLDSMGGTEVLVGGWGNDDNGPNSGSASLFSGASTIPVWTANGQMNGDRFGWEVSEFGSDAGTGVSLTPDGTVDVLVGAIEAENFPRPNTGAVYACSGTDGAFVWTARGTLGNENLGFAICSIADLNNDGVREVLAGGPGYREFGIDAGGVRVLNGADGTLIRHIKWNIAGDRFGAAVCATGDMDGDMVEDFMVGVPNNDDGGVDAGQIRAYSGARILDPMDDGLINTLNGSLPGALFGTSIGHIGDVGGANYVIIGAPGDSTNGVDAGSARVIQADMAGMAMTIWERFGSAAGDQMGAAVAGAGDPNGDGILDAVVGYPFQDNNLADDGSVRIMSGADGTTLGLYIGNRSQDLLGSSVDGAGDYSQNSFDDIVAGAPLNDNNGSGSGSAYVFEGMNALAIELDQFIASRGATGHGQVFWSTFAEIDNAGFNLYRQPFTPDVPTAMPAEAILVNRLVIPARGSTFEPASYRWIDSTTTSAEQYYYWLEDIDIRGVRTLHGPIVPR